MRGGSVDARVGHAFKVRSRTASEDQSISTSLLLQPHTQMDGENLKMTTPSTLSEYPSFDLALGTSPLFPTRSLNTHKLMMRTIH